MAKEKNKEDLGLVVKTKEEAFWIEVKELAEHQIQDLEKGLKLQTAILSMAEKNLGSFK